MDRETILVVDDDKSIRRVLSEILRSKGYEVVECCDANDALTVMDRESGAIGTMIADYSLAGMTGLALAREVRRLTPWVKILIISGHSRIGAQCRSEGEFAFLAKPFGTADVLRALDRMDTGRPIAPKRVQAIRIASHVA
jgi:DNA-binding NtrC family response regulator